MCDGRRRRAMSHEDELIGYTSVLGLSLHMCRGSRLEKSRLQSNFASLWVWRRIIAVRLLFIVCALLRRRSGFQFFLHYDTFERSLWRLFRRRGRGLWRRGWHGLGCRYGRWRFYSDLGSDGPIRGMRVSWQRDAIRLLLAESFQFFAFSLLALAFLQFLTLPDRVEKHDLILFESAKLVR